MTPHRWFEIANALAALAWLLLALSLFVSGTGLLRMRLRLIAGRVVPFVLALGYVAALVGYQGTAAPGGGFGSLQAVGILFAAPGVLLAGWVHYLAFDLLVGRWVADDSSERGVPAWAVLGCLFMVFMFGPAGWLLYLAARQFLGPKA